MWTVTYWSDATKNVVTYGTRNEARSTIARIKALPNYVPGKCFVVARVVPANNRFEAARKVLSLAKRQGDKFVRPTV
jgi:hypothetical protein